MNDDCINEKTKDQEHHQSSSFMFPLSYVNNEFNSIMEYTNKQTIISQEFFDIVIFFSILFWVVSYGSKVRTKHDLDHGHDARGRWRPNVMYLPILLLRWIFVPHRDWMKEHAQYYYDHDRHHHDHHHHDHHHDDHHHQYHDHQYQHLENHNHDSHRIPRYDQHGHITRHHSKDNHDKDDGVDDSVHD